MINQMAIYFENMASGVGVSIKIPRPSRAAKSACSVMNALIGTALIGAGTILEKPSLIVLGTLGIAGAALLSLDK